MRKHAEIVNNQQIIGETIARADDIRNRLQALRTMPYGANWLEKNQARLQRLPTGVLMNLKQRAIKNNPVIHEERQLAEQEKEDLRVMGTALASSSGMGYVERIMVGTLEGLQVLKRQGNDEIDIIESRLNDIELAFINGPSKESKNYRKWAGWCKSFEKHFEAVEELILEGQRFFCKNNLGMLQLLPMDNRSKIQLAALKFDCYPQLAEGVEATRASA